MNDTNKTDNLRKIQMQSIPVHVNAPMVLIQAVRSEQSFKDGSLHSSISNKV